MPRRLSALLLTAVLLLGGVAACSDDGGGEAADDGADATTTTEAEVEELAPPEVELVDAGVAPRKPLRLAPADDCASSTTLDQSIEQTVDTGQAEPSTTTTHLQLDLTAVCTSVTEDRIEYVTTYDAIRAPEDPASAELYAAVQGTQITTTVDRRGNIVAVTSASGDPDSETSTDELAQQLQQAATPFPDEAVGLGAVWRTSSDRASNGIPSTVVTEYTITKLEGSIVETSVRSTLTFTKGPFQLATPAGNAPAEVVAGELLGTGTMTWDLGQVTSTSDQTVAGTSTMRVDTSDGSFEVDQTQHQHVVVTNRPTG